MFVLHLLYDGYVHQMKYAEQVNPEAFLVCQYRNTHALRLIEETFPLNYGYGCRNTSGNDWSKNGLSPQQSTMTE